MDNLWHLSGRIFPGFTTVEILNETQQMMRELQRERENFTGRIIFMSNVERHSMGCKRKWLIMWVNNSKTISRVWRKISSRSFVFLGAWIWKDVVRNLRWHGYWNRAAEKVLQNFKDSVIWHSDEQALFFYEDKQEAKEEERQQFTSTENIKLLFQMVISVNQFSFAERYRIWLKNYQLIGGNSYSTSSRRIASQWRVTGKPDARTWGTIWEIIKRPEIIQTMLRSRQFFCTSPLPRPFCREHPLSPFQKRTSKQCTFCTSLGHEILQSLRKITVLKFRFNLCFSSNRIKY